MKSGFSKWAYYFNIDEMKTEESFCMLGLWREIGYFSGCSQAEEKLHSDNLIFDLFLFFVFFFFVFFVVSQISSLFFFK